MLSDRYGNRLSSSSSEACDAYVAAVDLMLSANSGAEPQFERATALDPGLAVAHAGLARSLQIAVRPLEAKAAIARAVELAPASSTRERGHVAVLDLLINGKSAEALAAARIAAYCIASLRSPAARAGSPRRQRRLSLHSASRRPACAQRTCRQQSVATTWAGQTCSRPATRTAPAAGISPDGTRHLLSRLLRTDAVGSS